MFDRNVHDKTYKSFSCRFFQEFEDTSRGFFGVIWISTCVIKSESYTNSLPV